MMTRQHFEAVAATMASIRPEHKTGPYEQWRQAVLKLAVTFARFNIGFNAAKFYKACGLED